LDVRSIYVPETLFSFEKFSFLVLALAKFSFLVLALANFSVLIVWTVGSGATAKLGTPADGVRTRHGEGERDTRSTRGLCNFKGLWSLVSSDISFFSSNASLFFLSPKMKKRKRKKEKENCCPAAYSFQALALSLHNKQHFTPQSTSSLTSCIPFPTALL
jgi:hypothetical protein